MTKKEEIEAAIVMLDELAQGELDAEAAHVTADIILLATVPEEVKKAYLRLVDSKPGWAYS